MREMQLVMVLLVVVFFVLVAVIVVGARIRRKQIDGIFRVLVQSTWKVVVVKMVE